MKKILIIGSHGMAGHIIKMILLETKKFLIFDIEIIFMYPWAVAFAKLSNAGFYAMMIFFVLLVIGFIYEIKKGALTWN